MRIQGDGRRHTCQHYLPLVLLYTTRFHNYMQGRLRDLRHLCEWDKDQNFVGEFQVGCTVGKRSFDILEPEQGYTGAYRGCAWIVRISARTLNHSGPELSEDVVLSTYWRNRNY